MTLTKFMDERYKNREDKDNMFGVGVSDTEFRSFIIDYLLGLGISLAKHGEPREDKYSFFNALFGASIQVGLLILGGFFK